MESMMRNALLYLSKNRMANRTAKKYGLRFGAKRFVAGESVSEAIGTVKRLNEQGIVATLDHLGEFVGTVEEAELSTEACLHTLDEIERSGVRSNLSLKLTQLGLDLSPELCLANMRRILDRASAYGNFVRIDMEDYAHNEPAIELFCRLRERYGDTVGLVIQAYLYKSEADLARLSVYAPNLRLVKGAYKEPPEVAYPDKADVDRSFIKLIETHLANGHYAAVATHDDNVIEHTIAFAARNRIPLSQFEFQMLYGIRPQRQLELASAGYTMRVYVPFGNDWYGYFMRRLAERPANVAFVMKSMFKS
ncbi:proline dehydrogenase family protein [Paenibacillus flagellatus]|uniref:proline dehydrogenase n=1 Tax=Paenibacillus flagellatus TaxID=2211139 RepID=A0A2V5JYI5_9BACL|nr:proline dehydrogenase family protein [Paenibacillus flagellatus]PYI51771.1 proline dehydrogenase [Paenibacillus flagellatus]